MSVILLLAGVIAGSFGAFVFLPASIAFAMILITTPLVVRIVDDMLIEKWLHVTMIFLLITAYVSICIWA